MDDNFERIERQYLNKDFVLSNFQRFILLPFIGKYENELVKPIVVATVYDVGMITIQLSIGYTQSSLDISTKEPNHFTLNDLQLYKKKENYSSKDFWDKDTVDKATIYDIMNYYFDQLSVICSGIKLTREKNKQIAWVFGDLKLSERGTHSDFVNQHKESYVSHLTNSPKQLIKKMSKDNMSEILDSNTIVKLKSMHFYCAEAISLLSFSSSSFSEDILSQIEEYSPDIKDDKKIFNEVFEMLCKSYVEFEMNDLYSVYFLLENANLL